MNEGRITIDLDGDGLLDTRITAAIMDLVDTYRYDPECWTLAALAERLGMHTQRCSRLIKAIDRIRARTEKA
jgi:hypothetical protein